MVGRLYRLGAKLAKARTGESPERLGLVETVVFGATSTAVGLSQDMSNGIIDRSLPMSRSAVLAGLTIAEMVRNVFVVVLIIVVGMAVGFRFHNGFAPAVAAVLVALLLGYALSCVFALIGLTVADPETAQLAGFWHAAGRPAARHHRQQPGHRREVGNQPAGVGTRPPYRDDVLILARTGRVSGLSSSAARACGVACRCLLPLPAACSGCVACIAPCQPGSAPAHVEDQGTPAEGLAGMQAFDRAFVPAALSDRAVSQPAAHRRGPRWCGR
jgi:hypothetical protein